MKEQLLELKLELLDLNHKIEEKKNQIEKLEFSQYENCNHLVTLYEDIYEDYDSHRRMYYGCIKCGLNNYFDGLVNDNGVMKSYLKKYGYKIPGDYFDIEGYFQDSNGYFFGVRDKYFEAVKIYNKLSQKNPDISNEELKNLVCKMIEDKFNKKLILSKYPRLKK